MLPLFADNLRDYSPFFPWIGAALAIFALVASIRASYRRRLIDTLPTSKAQGVFIGLVELKGTAECEQPITSYLAEIPCIYYSFNVEEQWSKTVTVQESDGKGGTRTVTRRESGWTTVASETQSTPFYLQDDTGHILIHPEGARIEPQHVFDQTCTAFDSLFYAKGPPNLILYSDGIRRFTEAAIPLQAQIFMVGQARERKDIVAPEIAYDPKASDFLISVRTEEEVSSGLGWQFKLFCLLGLVVAPGGHLAYDLAQDNPISPLAILFFISEAFLFAFCWFIGWAITAYNSLIELRQRVEQGWAQVDIQLKRRHDLIPNLVNTVQGYKTHEATTQEALAEMRQQLTATAPGQPGSDYQSLLGQLTLLKEAYPDLKANDNFLALQKSLSDTEQRIALARSYFNSIATFYNTRLEILPDRYLAALAAMKPRVLMEATDFERAPVPVTFATPPAPEPTK